MNLDADDLILFARIVDAGSLAAAAERAGLPKSTLSRPSPSWKSASANAC